MADGKPPRFDIGGGVLGSSPELRYRRPNREWLGNSGKLPRTPPCFDVVGRLPLATAYMAATCDPLGQ